LQLVKQLYHIALQVKHSLRMWAHFFLRLSLQLELALADILTETCSTTALL